LHTCPIGDEAGPRARVRGRRPQAQAGRFRRFKGDDPGHPEQSLPDALLKDIVRAQLHELTRLDVGRSRAIRRRSPTSAGTERPNPARPTLRLDRPSGTLGEAACLRTIQQRQPAKDARAVRKGGLSKPERRATCSSPDARRSSAVLITQACIRRRGPGPVAKVGDAGECYAREASVRRCAPLLMAPVLPQFVHRGSEDGCGWRLPSRDRESRRRRRQVLSSLAKCGRS
jgi:hypothetical protein